MATNKNIQGQEEKITTLYCRLSQDDNLEGEKNEKTLIELQKQTVE